MKEQNREKRQEELLQWHSAFYAGIQIELAEEAKYLEFENEHMLSSRPMQLDVLIIKKDKARDRESISVHNECNCSGKRRKVQGE